MKVYVIGFIGAGCFCLEPNPVDMYIPTTEEVFMETISMDFPQELSIIRISAVELLEIIPITREIVITAPWSRIQELLTATNDGIRSDKELPDP